MTAEMIWREIQQIPWTIVILQALNFFVMFWLWQFTKHHYRVAWIHFAPEKAKDVVRETQAALAESEVERQRLATELARLRGMIEGAKARLRRPQDLELVERRTATR